MVEIFKEGGWNLPREGGGGGIRSYFYVRSCSGLAYPLCIPGPVLRLAWYYYYFPPPRYICIAANLQIYAKILELCRSWRNCCRTFLPFPYKDICFQITYIVSWANFEYYLHLPSFYLSIYLPIYLSIYLSKYPSIYLSVSLYLPLSRYISL